MRWWWRKQREQDLDRELCAHLELEAEEQEADVFACGGLARKRFVTSSRARLLMFPLRSYNGALGNSAAPGCVARHVAAFVTSAQRGELTGNDRSWHGRSLQWAGAAGQRLSFWRHRPHRGG
jgi:hypothetical protein